MLTPRFCSSLLQLLFLCLLRSRLMLVGIKPNAQRWRVTVQASILLVLLLLLL